MDLKSTLSFGSTTFEMRGNLAKKEPAMLKRWEEISLYELLMKERAGAKEYALHDGPPYANGDMHCGHMLNRLLKDFVVRSKSMEGYLTPFVPGWDTHGLPIESKLEKSGVSRKKMSTSAFREKCREYALSQVERQKAQIKRLGILADFEHPYVTLDRHYEADEIRLFGELALKGLVYKGVKPVYWSPKSESALAEAEVEYKDVEARTIYVAFKVADGKGKVPESASFAIWTTTPWTIPADLAVTLNPRFVYGLYDTDRGELVFLSDLKDSLVATLGLKKCELIKTFKGKELEGILLEHPLYERTSPVIVNDYVTSDTGTGCVHTAPDHGVDDFNACAKYGIKPFCPVDEKGYLHLGKGDPLDGLFYAEANDKVVDILTEKGLVLKEVKIKHSYPHDWRTHTPLIFRATPQWFCSIAPIKEKLLKAVDEVEWKPAWGKQKMVNMIEGRTDWCISRQRAWGVPLPIIYEEDGTPIVSREVFEHIASIVEEKGTNAWFELDAKELLPEGYRSEKSPHGNYRKEVDTMDVWFDSGSSWKGVLLRRGMNYPADLYLEGNDQYRGWFNSSLILSVAVNGKAPYKCNLTHGWVMDENWKKMSKSSGNGIDPSKVADVLGADVLRLYAASVNYQSDVRLGESLVAAASDGYRKIRNFFRFLLMNAVEGELGDELSLGDRLVLNELYELSREVRDDYAAFAFPSATMKILSFVTEVSASYFESSKDVLYCDPSSSARKKAIQAVFYEIADVLLRLLAPILPFTMEEVYFALPRKEHRAALALETFKKVPEPKKGLAEVDADLSALREKANKSLEALRSSGKIASFLEAELDLACDGKLYEALSKEDYDSLSRLFLVGEVSLKKGKDDALALVHGGHICARCRKKNHDLHEYHGEEVCSRCLAALEEKE